MAEVYLGGMMDLTVKFKVSVRNPSGNVHSGQNIYNRCGIQGRYLD